MSFFIIFFSKKPTPVLFFIKCLLTIIYLLNLCKKMIIYVKLFYNETVVFFVLICRKMYYRSYLYYRCTRLFSGG